MRIVKLKRPAPGTVLGLVALIVAVVGNAHAAGTHTVVRKGDIAKGAVTAKALAAGAVHAKAIAAGAVHSKALAKESVADVDLRTGAVTTRSLAPDSVTANALAPGAVYGGALGPVTVHSAPISDLDGPPEISTWTVSETKLAQCAPGERLLTGGVVFTKSGNGRIGIIQSLPVANVSQTAWAGQITTDSGGTAEAEVQAVCLR